MKASPLAVIIGIWLIAPPAADGVCLGDHDQDSVVSVNELVVSVSNALSGCAQLPRFVDNGDGTVTDNDTTLVWERKDDADSVANPNNFHDADNTYWWSGVCPVSFDTCQPGRAAATVCVVQGEGEPEGCSECSAEAGACALGPAGITTVWDWVVQLNSGTGFAAHTDWRLPTRRELQSIAGDDAEECADLDVGFAGCGLSVWSASTPAAGPSKAWVVWRGGNLILGDKPGSFLNIGSRAVVAVRGGPLVDGQCLGDFDLDGAVSVSELVISLGNALNGCGRGLPRFIDNGDGTIADSDTGLTWEKKVELDGVEDGANLHDADNTYRWAGFCSSPLMRKLCQPDSSSAEACEAGVEGDSNGCSACVGDEGMCQLASGGITAVWDWLVELNSEGGFAGHTDWRLPTIRELQSIVDYDSPTMPSVAPAFDGSTCGPGCPDLIDPACSCTDSHTYWSASSLGDDAQVVDFSVGIVRSGSKTSFGFPSRARAVRP